jgi:histidine triad (HIT) family protein
LNNNGRSAGQLIDHVHFHIIPRNSGDGIIQHAPQGKYQPGRIEEIADMVRELLK